ncbi:hypothetical protein AT864_01028 [Anoxybacillus sp. P3H1B]|uniref:stalk domain-containing protein n=1 Tax=Anoxybacillus sp. P3H1B TaxID=1769293 RepID=UPI000793BC9F|nr:stalk domain-containing protein [Anoxybacillus sp. P3H1B]KXG10437.1 hypothetical protein AT864_01028 [Anoxybacillus sp. P3H1B]
MVRTAILMMMIFLGISGGTAYMQWRDYEKSNQVNDHAPLVHSIDIRHEEGSLEITQTVDGLKNQSYEIVVPKEAQQFRYRFGDKENMQNGLNAGASSIEGKEHERLIMQYMIPLPISKTIWLEHWSVMFVTKQTQKFHVQFVDYATKDGMWIAGAPLEAKIKKQAFTLYSWSQANLLSFPLYFYPSELPRQVDGDIEVYGKRSMGNGKLQKWADVPSLTIVQSPQNDQHISPVLVVIPESGSLSAVREQYMRAYYASYFAPNALMNEWLADLLTALTFQKPATTSRAKAVLQQFQQNLTEEERQEFLSTILQHKGEKLTPALLDKALTKAHLGKTTYFADLLTAKKNLDLVFTNEGNLYVNDKVLKEGKAVLRGGELLLPFKEVMEKLGYHVTQSGDAVFIEKGSNRWRFFVNSPVYMKENDQFGMPSIIIHDLNGTLYMSADMIQHWFSIEVWTSSQNIYVHGS